MIAIAGANSGNPDEWIVGVIVIICGVAYYIYRFFNPK